MNDLILIPYIEIDGQWTLKDSILESLYNLSKQEGSADTVFYSGGMNSAGDFVETLKQKDSYVVLVIDKHGPPVGIVWIRDYGRNYAYGHFVFFKNSWGNGKSVEGLKMAAEHFFSIKKPDGAHLLDVLIGMMAEENTRAHNFVDKCGFTLLGVIPKILYNHNTKQKTGAMYCYIEREA